MMNTLTTKEMHETFELLRCTASRVARGGTPAGALEHEAVLQYRESLSHSARAFLEDCIGCSLEEWYGNPRVYRDEMVSILQRAAAAFFLASVGTTSPIAWYETFEKMAEESKREPVVWTELFRKLEMAQQ